jgi:hypothetical protein
MAGPEVRVRGHAEYFAAFLIRNICPAAETIVLSNAAAGGDVGDDKEAAGPTDGGICKQRRQVRRP